MSAGSLAIYTHLPSVGGHSTTTLELVKAFRAANWEVHLLTRHLAGHGYCEKTHAAIATLGAHLHRLDTGAGQLDREALVRALLLLRSRQWDGFLAIGTRYLSTVFSLVCRTKRKVYYHITHSPEKKTLQFLKRLSPFFDRMAVISPQTIFDAGADPFAKKMEWHPAIAAFAAAPAHEYSQPTRSFGFLGRFTEHKGILELLDIWKRSMPDARLHLMGDGHLKDRVMKAVDGSKFLHYHGSFDASEREIKLAGFFPLIDTLIVPTKTDGEGLPNVLLEALSCGVPVITTPLGGTRMFLSHPSFQGQTVIQFAKPEDMEATLVDESRRPAPDAAKGQACLDFVAKHFSAEELGRRWVKIFSD